MTGKREEHRMAYPQLTEEPGALATAAAIREGRLSVTEAVDAAIVRLEHLDASIDALAVPNFEAAYAAARALDAAGPPKDGGGDQPLFGVPMTMLPEVRDSSGDLRACCAPKWQTWPNNVRSEIPLRAPRSSYHPTISPSHGFVTAPEVALSRAFCPVTIALPGAKRSPASRPRVVRVQGATNPRGRLGRHVSFRADPR
jgi:hypothetical protein